MNPWATFIPSWGSWWQHLSPNTQFTLKKNGSSCIWWNVFGQFVPSFLSITKCIISSDMSLKRETFICACLFPWHTILENPGWRDGRLDVLCMYIYIYIYSRISFSLRTFFFLPWIWRTCSAVHEGGHCYCCSPVHGTFVSLESMNFARTRHERRGVVGSSQRNIHLSSAPRPPINHLWQAFKFQKLSTRYLLACYILLTTVCILRFW